MKECYDCKENKELTSFGKLTSSKDGLNHRCLECAKIKLRKWRKENPEKEAALKLKGKSYYSNNIDKEANRKKLYYVNNTEIIKERCTNWAKENPDKIKAKESRYFKRHPGKKNAKTAKRRAAKLQATPNLLNKEQLKEIESFYIKAKEMEKETGIKYHVDHIIPLNGKTVSGLHVPWNLQILEASENIRKSNKLLGDI